MDIIETKDITAILPIVKQFQLPRTDSHKGQNGRLLIIGGSALFHSAVVWSAQLASHFVDMVHVATTHENNEIIQAIKIKWHEGIVVPQYEIPKYVEEDDAVLLGTGMVREQIDLRNKEKVVEDNNTKDYRDWKQIVDMHNEGKKTFEMTRWLLKQYPHKQWVIDAGSLQMMDVSWFMHLKQKPIITPHQKEFELLTGQTIQNLPLQEKTSFALDFAKKHKVILLLKAIDDIVTDGSRIKVIRGGNSGLTKGGTGDTLASMVACFSLFLPSFESAVLASYVLKKAADDLFPTYSTWFNTSDLIDKIPQTLRFLIDQD